MKKSERMLFRVIRGTSDAGIPFEDLRVLLKGMGFVERTRGSHHIFTCDGVDEILNLQPKGSLAKAYQVRQVRGVLLKYRLAGESDEV